MWIFSLRSRLFSKRARGFTVIELMVASAIILIITSVILFRQSRFNSATLLRSLAYSMALSIRQAQTYGVSVRETTSGSNRFPSYGVYFKSGDLTHYFLAADLNGNGAVATDGTEDVSPPSPYSLSQGYQIKDVCATVQGTGAQHCFSNGIITKLTIRFVRPNPDALFVSDAPGNPTYTSAYIQITAPGEDTRGITVTSTGQISVGNSGS
jgi:prepilin-type N-terminal cleavage/methylation domain-containing protein